jgi:hypothetical protein
MSYKFISIVDVQSRQYCFDLEKGVIVKTIDNEFEINLENLKEEEIFNLVSSKNVFQIKGKNSNFIVNPNNVVGIFYSSN